MLCRELDEARSTYHRTRSLPLKLGSCRAGRWRYAYHAVDQSGQIVDVFALPRRDARAARPFFQRANVWVPETRSHALSCKFAPRTAFWMRASDVLPMRSVSPSPRMRRLH